MPRYLHETPLGNLAWTVTSLIHMMVPLAEISALLMRMHSRRSTIPHNSSGKWVYPERSSLPVCHAYALVVGFWLTDREALTRL